MKIFITLFILGLFSKGNAIQAAQYIESNIKNVDAKTDSKFAIRINPIGTLYGVYGGALDYKFHKHWLISPTYQYFGKNVDPRNLELDQYGLSLTYCYLGPCYENSWFGRATFGSLHVTLDREVNTVIYTGEMYTPFARFLVGRNWKIYKGFQAGIGVGTTQALVDRLIELKDSNGRTFTEDAPVSRRFKAILEMYITYVF